ncbi:hypothetical protein ACRARE_18335 [Pseudooceanicola sp. 200-1SW]
MPPDLNDPAPKGPGLLFAAVENRPAADAFGEDIFGNEKRGRGALKPRRRAGAERSANRAGLDRQGGAEGDEGPELIFP